MENESQKENNACNSDMQILDVGNFGVQCCHRNSENKAMELYFVFVKLKMCKNIKRNLLFLPC